MGSWRIERPEINVINTFLNQLKFLTKKIELNWKWSILFCGGFAYHDDDEIEPTPGVGEVVLEAQRQPFDEHFDEEDDGEDAIHVVEDVLQDRTLRQVDVLQCLQWNYSIFIHFCIDEIVFRVFNLIFYSFA